MNRTKIAIATAVALCAMMLLAGLPTNVEASSVPYVFFEEDVEEPTFMEWHVRWNKYDANPESSQDFFCRQMHNAHTGTHAAWCARSGYNSHYLNDTGLQPMNVNITSMQPPLDYPNMVLRYDTNMDSFMRKELVGASYYETITLTFWFYSDTGKSDARQPDTGSYVGYDFLNVVYFTGTSSLVKHVLWTDSEAQATAKTWTEVQLLVPNDATWVGFEFVSGSNTPEGGDASDAFTAYGVRTMPNGARGMKEGVFIDDIKVEGSDPTNVSPMVTTMSDLPSYEANTTFPVSFTDNDPVVPMAWVNLYYRQAGIEEWTKYTTSTKPQGAFTSSPIMFTAPADGAYEFFIQGKDSAGDLELWEGLPDAMTVVDTALPSSVVSLSGNFQGGAYSGSAKISMNGTDYTSGLDRIMYRVDGSQWKAYTTPISIVANGTHILEYYSVDKAGNAESVRTMSVTVVNGQTGVVFEDSQHSFTDGNVTLNFVVAIPSEVTKLEYSLDRGTYIALDTNATSVTMSGVGDGEHTLTVRATDADGKATEGSTSFKVGTVDSQTNTSGSVDPMVLGIIGIVAVAAIGGAFYFLRKKK